MTDRWTAAWFAACASLTAHVSEEMLLGGYGVYADIAWIFEALPRAFELPPFREEVWLVNVAGALGVLFALTLLVYARRGPMVFASYALAAFVTGNGVLHVLMAAMLKSWVPGMSTAPLLIAAGLFLFASTGASRAALRVPQGSVR